MSHKIKTLHLSFDLPIYARQIKNWRGAFLQMAGWQDDIFHNHDNASAPQNTTDQKTLSKYHYRYPLIQYRVRQGKAAIFALNDGVPALQKTLAENDWNIEWEGQPCALQIEDLRMNEHALRMAAQPQRYKLFKWLALTGDSYEEWQTQRNMLQRVQLLEKKLQNHLIGLFLNLGWDWPERIEVNLELISKVQFIPVHGTKLCAFDVEFSTNVLLPPGIAIGKSVSRGFGSIVPLRTQHQQESFEFSSASISADVVADK